MTVALEHPASTAMQRGEASRRRLENEGIAIDRVDGFLAERSAWPSALNDLSDVSATRCRLQPAPARAVQYRDVYSRSTAITRIG